MNDKENQKMRKPTLRIFLGCLACTLLLLFRHGYTFGSGDQSEMLPYAKYLIDNQLYPSDFYIQSIASWVPNERYAFSSFMSLFGDKMDWAAFGLHFSATMLLILGLYRLAKEGLDTEGGRWLAVLMPVMVLYGVNLGGNELYYNAFLPSYVAQVMGVWVFIFAMRGEALPTYVLLMLMTYVHPLIGVQLWLLINLSFLTMRVLGKNAVNLISLLIFNALYLLTAAFFIYKIKSGFDAGSVNNQQFLDIIRFRAAHHYFPDAFPLKNWLILALPFYIGWRVAGDTFRYIFRWIVVGVVVYMVGIYIFKNPTPLSMQWFSTMVWVKMFSFMITFTLIKKLMDKSYLYEILFKPKHLVLNILIALSLLSVVLMMPQFRLLKNKPYDFPFFKTENAEVNISKLAKEKTPPDALFLILSDLSEFRFWSERSSYIDFKATNHRQGAFVEWYARIQQVYKISLADRLKGEPLTYLANYHFQELRTQDFKEFAKNQHITHIVTYKNVGLKFKRIAENEKYVIYRL